MTKTSVSPSTTSSGMNPGGIVYAVMRIGIGLLFMQHGAQKLFGMLGGNQVELMSQMGLAGVLELFGGLLIVLGLLTRPVAIILCIEMLWAYVQVHMPQGGAPIQNGGELALLYALVYAFVASYGAGLFSVDEKLRERA